ncbi:uncharacterized protein [Cicer arietinum]|uniref:uncharacterized protein isoform X2 n=1 Tax=Cicer arietinum TaxID=3827 RepID=UPI003CC5781D
MMVLLGIQLIPLLGRDVIRESVESHSIPSDIEVEEEQIEKEVEPKRARGPTKMLDVWEMEDGDLIIVNLDKYGRPIGEEGTTLTRFIGSVARRYQYAPINYKSWKVMPNDYKEEMLKLIEKISKINRQNRAKFEDVHCMGSKSLPKFIDEKVYFYFYFYGFNLN